jgi:DNA polymerase III subunit epsilon
MVCAGSLRAAPTLSSAIDQLAELLSGCIFTAHNADFDAAFIEQAAVEAGVTVDLSQRLCTLRMSRLLDPQRELPHRLADLCNRYQVSLDRPHDALEDALATAAVLAHLLKAHDVRTVAQVLALTDTVQAPAPQR